MKSWLSSSLIALAAAVSTPVWAIDVIIEIHGMDAALTTHVQQYLDIYRAQNSVAQTISRLQRHHSKAEEQIRTALQVYGYYQPKMQLELKQLEAHWIANYIVDPGPAITIDSLDVQIFGPGRDEPALRELINQFPLQQGQVLEHPAYDQARDGLLRQAIVQGYLDANMVKRELGIDLKRYSARVTLHLDTGKRYYFGPVDLQQDFMNDEFVRRFVRIQPGEIYNPAKLLLLQRELSDSGLFQSVEVRPNRQQAVDERVPIDVMLTARKRNQWRFGLGYATDTGARGIVSHSRILGRGGHKFDGRVLISEKKENFILGYTIPLQDPATDQLGFGMRYTDETTDSRQSQIFGLTTSHVTNWGEWRRIISLNFERENYIIGTEPEDRKDILFPALSVNRVRADDRLNTRHGSRVYAEVRGANENLFSDTNYGQLRLGLKWIRGLGDDARVLLRGDFGTTNVGSLDKLPASQRFYAGGDNSVRGYAYEELGPTNADGEVVGGKHLMVGSIELEHRLSGNWYAAAFYDVGNAINSFGDELFTGAGVGIHWNSPVGPIRFDFAWALDKPADRFRLHVVIGPDL